MRKRSLFLVLAFLVVGPYLGRAFAACSASTTCVDGQVVSCTGTTSCVSKCGLVNCDGSKKKCNVPCCSAQTDCEFGPTPIYCETRQNFDCSVIPGYSVHCDTTTLFCEEPPPPPCDPPWICW